MSYLLLAGGSEFGGQMREPDLKAIELAGGFDAPICIVPTAAAADNNHKRAGSNGVRWFQSLGAKNVFSVNVIDSQSANDEEIANLIRQSKLVYMLGGFPRYLGDTLKNSICWKATLEVYQNGGLIGGSSAGAMVLCEYYYDPYEQKLLQGLNLISNACVLPHHNQFGKTWAKQLRALLPNSVLIGIDEGTGMILEGGQWQVYGRGEVNVYRAESTIRYERGASFSLYDVHS